MNTMNDLRSLYELLKATRTGEAIRYTKKLIRRKLASLPDDPLKNTLREEWRTRYAEHGESWVEYCIMEDDGERYDEIKAYCREMEVHNHSQYDCTGKPCTTSIHWRRCPCGIVFIHHLALDV